MILILALIEYTLGITGSNFGGPEYVLGKVCGTALVPLVFAVPVIVYRYLRSKENV